MTADVIYLIYDIKKNMIRQASFNIESVCILHKYDEKNMFNFKN